MSHRPTSRRLLAAAPLAALALGLSACSTSVPQDDVEERISTELSDQLGAAPDDVSCPDDLAAEEGGTLDCTVTVDGQDTDVTVTVDSVDGDTVNYTITPAE